MLKRIVPFAALLFVIIGFFLVRQTYAPEELSSLPTINIPFQSKTPTPTKPPVVETPQSKTLSNSYHIYQSFNNCGPASLSMALSYYNITISQQVLGDSLRPYQNPQGVNDDKSVTLEEMGKEAQKYGLIPFHRPNGSTELLTKFIANDIPVITRTWLEANEDIGHYRVVKGYDKTSQTLIQDDSYQGDNLTYSYSDFNEIWGKFNYEYLVLVPAEKEAIAREILGEDVDEKVSWQKAARTARAALTVNPDDIYTRFNLSVALYHIDDFEGSIREYELVQNRLPFRTLWYQLEPIQAYYERAQYDRVFQITDTILNNANRSYSELYIIRGTIYKQQGNIAAAREEFEKAVLYNQNLKEAHEALATLN